MSESNTVVASTKKDTVASLETQKSRSSIHTIKGKDKSLITSRKTFSGAGDGPPIKLKSTTSSTVANADPALVQYLLSGDQEQGRRDTSKSSDQRERRSYSDISSGVKAMMIKYMNTFRLESKNPFRKEPVHNIIRDVFKAELETMNYEPAILSKACAVIASEIRNRVKALGYERYKLVCVVQICEKNKQSVNSLAKFLWDPEKDNCASYSCENSYFLAAGAVFGLYYE